MPIPWSVAEFADLVHGSRSRHKAMAMLVGRFDESGVHAASEVTCIAGIIGAAMEQSRLEKPWQEHLKLAGVSVFHATECVFPKKKKGEYYGVPEPVRTTLINSLSEEIAKREIRLLVAAISQKDWNLPELEPIRKRYETPYHFCFECILDFIEAWARKHAGGEPVALQFAEHEEYESRAARLYEKYRASPAYHCIGSFGWAKPKCLVPIQAADLVCYESWQHMWGHTKPGYEPRQPFKTIQAQYLSQSGFFEREQFMNLIAREKIA